jgi:hypothetical protein
LLIAGPNLTIGHTPTITELRPGEPDRRRMRELLAMMSA